MERETECVLVEKAQGGCLRSRDRLIVHNLGFIIQTLSKQYKGVDFHELLSAGCLGMATAIDKFDTGRGLRLISYAVHWIRQASYMQMRDDRTVRLPDNVVNLQRQIHRRMGDTGESFEEAMSALDLTDQQRSRLTLYLKHGASLDKPMGDGEERDAKTLHDLLADEDQELQDWEMERNEVKEDVLAVVSSLDRQERDLIRKYYGLYDQKPQTFKR